MKKQQDNKANRAKRSIGGCAFYNVAICMEGDHWTRFHSNNVDY